MDHLHITGGSPLRGTATVGGSKNASLAILAASLLSETPVFLERLPRSNDLLVMSQLLRSLGMEVDPPEQGRCTLSPIDHAACAADDTLGQQLRASICLLGPLLASRGSAVVGMPGGCNLGHRPVDLHIRGLRALGATIELDQGRIVAKTPQLEGARINLGGPHGPTVTGTCNIMSAASKARGETIIEGAAREPEVVAVGQFLRRLGARITGLGSSRILIQGVDRLCFPTQREPFEIPADRIEAATLLLAGAASAVAGQQAEVTLQNIAQDDLNAVIAALRAAGHRVNAEHESVTLIATGPSQPTALVARPFPGLPTDLQPIFVALAATATGTSQVRDTVFPHRWMHLAELGRLGASILLRNDTAIVRGSTLRGAAVRATDLRAAAGLIVAGMAAEGKTIVGELEHLDRGYERLDLKLSALGAKVRRVKSTSSEIDHSSSPRNSGCPNTFLPEVIGPRLASSRKTV